MLGVFEFIISIIFIFLLVVYVIYLDIKSDTEEKTQLNTQVNAYAKTDDATSNSNTGATATSNSNTGATATSNSNIGATATTNDYTDTCKLKCTKATKVDGSCYHPIKYNPLLKKNQEIKSELICPWQCSSGYSDDPNTCRYNSDCIGCSPTVSFPNIDNLCPKSTYGCCGNTGGGMFKLIEKTDEFGNNCLGITGATGSTGCTGGTGGNCFEGFSGLEGMVSDSDSKNETTNNDSNKYNQSIPNKTMYPTCPNIQCPNESAFQKDAPSKAEVSLETLPPYPWPVVTDYTTFGV